MTRVQRGLLPVPPATALAPPPLMIVSCRHFHRCNRCRLRRETLIAPRVPPVCMSSSSSARTPLFAPYSTERCMLCNDRRRSFTASPKPAPGRRARRSFPRSAISTICHSAIRTVMWWLCLRHKYHATSILRITAYLSRGRGFSYSQASGLGAKGPRWPQNNCKSDL
jgi:hypothetical protein